MNTLPYWVFACLLLQLKHTRLHDIWQTMCWFGLAEVAKMTWESPNTWRGLQTQSMMAIAMKRTVISMEYSQMASPAKWWKLPWCLAKRAPKSRYGNLETSRVVVLPTVWSFSIFSPSLFPQDLPALRPSPFGSTALPRSLCQRQPARAHRTGPGDLQCLAGLGQRTAWEPAQLRCTRELAAWKFHEFWCLKDDCWLDFSGLQKLKWLKESWQDNFLWMVVWAAWCWCATGHVCHFLGFNYTQFSQV